MLLNEFLKEHRKVHELEATIAQQQKGIEALTVGLQKVSAQVGVRTLGAKVIATEQPTGKRTDNKYESAD